MKHRGGSYAHVGSSGRTGGRPPDAKRFRHENWTGISGVALGQNIENPYIRQNSVMWNEYGAHARRRQGWSDWSNPADHMFPFSRSRAVRPPFTAGHLRGSKSGAHSRSQSNSKSNSALRTDIYDKLVMHTDGLHARALASMLSCQKKVVNHILYSMQRDGLVEKVSETPAVWVLIRRLNSAAVNSGINSQPNSSAKLQITAPATCTYCDVSARSVVPLQVQTTVDEVTASNTSESFDVIPAASVRNNAVSTSTGIFTSACSNCQPDPSATSVNAENVGSCPGENIDWNIDICQNVSSSGDVTAAAPFVHSAIISDTLRSKRSTLSGDVFPTVFGELKRPAGRGRGVLLLSAANDILAKPARTCSLPAEHRDINIKAEMCVDVDESGQFDSNIVMHSSSSDDVSCPTDTHAPTHRQDNISQLTEQFDHHRGCNATCDMPSSQREEQFSGRFKPPLPPKDLVTADPVYKMAVDCDDTNFVFRGCHFLLNRESADVFADSKSDTYRSLPESLGAMSFRPSSLPYTQSFDDLTKSVMPNHSTNNPFAEALGVSDYSSVGALSADQMPEAESRGLGLTGECFAALNKNPVSALMEYSQSRHVAVEIKCIKSFGPSHRPM